MSVPLVLTPSTVNFPVNTLYNIPVSAVDAVTKGFFVTFPAPWASVSPDPGIELMVKNNSTSAPIAPILLDKWVSAVDGKTYYYPVVEFSTVQPGQSSPISPGGLGFGETAALLPVTKMVLALMYLAVSLNDSNNGWNATVSAWAV